MINTSAQKPPDGGSPRLWYGWVIVAIVFLVMTTLIGLRTSFGVFFKTLTAEFGWSRAETSGAFSVAMLGYAFSAPFVGWLVDRWSIRWTMTLGVFIFSASMFMGFFVSALWHIYLMNFLLSMGFGAATHLPQMQVLSNWFIRRRGLALGLTSSAQGIAFSISALSSGLITWLGWRATYLVFGGFTLLVTLPIVALFLKDRPEDSGTVADAPFLDPEERAAAPSAAHEARQTVHTGGESFGGLILSLPFLVLFIVFASVAYIFTAFLVHLVPLATDHGFTPSGGAGLFALFGVSVFAGNLLSGISDRIGRTITYVASSLLGAGACLLLAIFFQRAITEQLILGGIAVGVALGTVRPTIIAMLADHFSGPAFGRVSGVMMMLFSLAGAAGPLVTGYLFDRFGRYRESALLLAAIFLLSSLLAIAQGRLLKAKQETA